MTQVSALLAMGQHLYPSAAAIATAQGSAYAWQALLR